MSEVSKRSITLVCNRDNLKGPFGLSRGDRITVAWDGRYMRYRSMSWSPKKLAEEVERGIWVVADD